MSDETAENNNPSDQSSLKPYTLSVIDKKAIVDSVSAEVKREINSVIQNDIKKDVCLWCKKWGTIILTIAGIISLIGFQVSLLRIHEEVSKKITISIADKFAEQRIQQTINDVAQNEAKNIIENRLNPAIAQAEKSIFEKTASFDKTLTEFKGNYDLQLKSLTQEVQYLKMRNEILKLADIAIAKGDVRSFEKLESMSSLNVSDEIKTILISEILRIKSSFASGTRIGNVDIKYTEPNTKRKFKDKEIPSEALILEAKNHNNIWQHRAKLVQLLNDRKERGVSEELLKIAKDTDHLEVRKEAINSFASVTGFKSGDVFDFKSAEEWWKQNKDVVEKEKEYHAFGTIKDALRK